MSGITWLAAYPKSGNTWLRALLTNYLRNGDQPANINDLVGGPIASARAWFDDWVGVEASSLDQATIDRLRPEVYRRTAGNADSALFLKVHDAWTRTDTGEPMFPADVTNGVVYIVRHPLDVAVSVAHHTGGTIEAAVEHMCVLWDLADLAREALPEQLRHRVGSWNQHVRSWVDDSGLAVHVVRYEDLCADSAAAFAGIVRFIGLEPDQARIRQAVAFSAFTELRRQEVEVGFRERPPKALGGFFRRGESGTWTEELPYDLACRLAEVCHETMSRFGYASPFT